MIIILLLTSVAEIQVKVGEVDEMSDRSNEELRGLSGESVLRDRVSTEADIEMSEFSCNVSDGIRKSSRIGDLVVLRINSESSQMSEVTPVLNDVFNRSAGELVHAQLKLKIGELREQTDSRAERNR